MLYNQTKGILRKLIYLIQFEKNPVDGINRVLSINRVNNDNHNSQDFIKAIHAGLKSSESLAQLIPQNHSESVIRDYLAKISDRIQQQETLENELKLRMQQGIPEIVYERREEYSQFDFDIPDSEEGAILGVAKKTNVGSVYDFLINFINFAQQDYDLKQAEGQSKMLANLSVHADKKFIETELRSKWPGKSSRGSRFEPLLLDGFTCAYVLEFDWVSKVFIWESANCYCGYAWSSAA